MAVRPWLLVTAVVDPAVQHEFDGWHRDVHLPRVLRIPGIVAGRRLTGPVSGPNYAALYVFADAAAMQTALASAEAQEARRDWAQWSDHVRELTVSFYAGLTPTRSLLPNN